MDLTGRQQILKALSKEGVEIRATFNYINHHDSLIPGIGKIFLFKLGGFLSGFRLILKQQLLLRQNLDVDFIILRAWKLHETLPLFFFVRYLLRKKKPKFILDLRTVPVDLKNSIHDRINVLRYKSGIYLALKFFDGLTVISEKLKQDIIEQYRCPQNKITVWTTGVDPEHFNPDCVGDMRQSLNISERFVIMYHGIFSPFRGLQEAIKAIALLKDKYPDILLVLLGKGEAQKEYEKLIDDLHLHNHARLLPPVQFKDVPRFINSADCGILPFPDLEWWNTSSPLKLNEYLAMGKPVVLTEIAAHKAVVKNEPFGFYSPDHNSQNIAKTIEAIYTSKERNSLKKSARKYAIENLTWASQAKKIKSFMAQLQGRVS
ncbi:MAG: glycosyltransferase family 4 protein [Desulfobacula sp.]